MKIIFIIFDPVQDAVNYGLKLMYSKTGEVACAKLSLPPVFLFKL